MESHLEEISAKRETELRILRALLAPYAKDDTFREESDALWEWVEGVTEQLVEADPMRLSCDHGPRAVVPQLFQLLRELLLTHRWADAALTLVRLCSEPQRTSCAIHRAGTELFLQAAGSEGSELMERLMKQIKVLLDLNTKVIGLDYFFYLMHDGMLKEAQNVLRNYPVRVTAGAKRKWSRMGDHVSSHLFHAYEGLAYYAEWLQVQQNLDPDDQMSEGGCRNALVLDEELTHIASKSVTCFADLDWKADISDIFILPYVELLEFLKKETEAESVLQSYCDSRPEHPNAWRYRLDFLKRHNREADAQRDILERLSRLVPSEANWALEYRDNLPFEDYSIERVTLLMSCLDFAENKTNDILWKALAADLSCLGNTSIVDLWAERADWWAEFHFSDDQLSEDLGKNSESCLNLLAEKAAVAHLLLGADNSYTSKVLESDSISDKPELNEWLLSILPKELIVT